MTTTLACTAVIALIVVWLVWNWRLRQLLQRQRQLERTVAERTHELQKEKQCLLALRDELRDRTTKDGLTGLLNRNAFFEELDREWSRLLRQPGSLALIMADLDFFKKVNDTYGHRAGDVVLKESAGRFVASVRSYDIVGRYGRRRTCRIAAGLRAGRGSQAQRTCAAAWQTVPSGFQAGRFP